MSNVEALKEQARRHEQRDEWEKACELYMKAIDRLDEEQPDIGLYNRVGDILIKVGSYDSAVEHYEKATDLYLEAELPNNAIAVCKKVIRHLPNRHETYLRMGKIRAAQGFLVDARENFLAYAERMQASGEVDEALRALVEFADLAPEDTDARMSVAVQLLHHEREEEALAQLTAGYAAVVRKGDEEASQAFADRILEIDPDADLVALARTAEDGDSFEFEATSLAAPDGDVQGGFDDISERTPGQNEETTDHEEGFGEFMDIALPGEGDDDLGSAVASAEPASGGGELSDVAGEVEADIHLELPLLSVQDDDEEVLGEGTLDAGPGPEVGEGAPELDTDQPDFAEIALADLEIDLGEAEDEEGEPEPLPLLDLGDDEPAEETDAAVGDLSARGRESSDRLEGAMEEAAVEPAGDSRTEWESLRERCAAEPANEETAQTLVEVAFRLDEPAILVESYLCLADALRRQGEGLRADTVLQQVLALEPDNADALEALQTDPSETGAGDRATPQKDYVDLGALIFSNEGPEKTTRFRVAYEEPSGDEEADFARLLTQFKEKVAENFDLSDVRTHHDLGTAYKEMGLLDEAVEKFQEALRASPLHLPTYELLGQTFMERGEHAAAVRVLERALRVSTDVEDDFIGIYYYLARAHEELGSTGRALEYYDHVFALDINFKDVTDRLRALR
jgi:tetratricopeptide (TPR) repeat protein